MRLDYESHSENSTASGQTTSQAQALAAQQSLPSAPDDQFPGSFFRIPGIPTPNATWNLVE